MQNSSRLVKATIAFTCYTVKKRKQNLKQKKTKQNEQVLFE